MAPPEHDPTDPAILHLGWRVDSLNERARRMEIRLDRLEMQVGKLMTEDEIERAIAARVKAQAVLGFSRTQARIGLAAVGAALLAAIVSPILTVVLVH